MNDKLFNISLLAAGVLLASVSPVNASGYIISPLYGFSSAHAINNAGQVAGWTGAGHPIATVWNGTTATNLGTLLGGANSAAIAINNSGQVAGWSNTDATGGPQHATIWNGTTATVGYAGWE